LRQILFIREGELHCSEGLWHLHGLDGDPVES
jgi:hypothetical protein